MMFFASRLYECSSCRWQAHNRRIRRWELLWYVHGMALKWQAFAKRKERRMREFQAALEIVDDADMQMVIKRLIEALAKASTDEVIMAGQSSSKICDFGE